MIGRRGFTLASLGLVVGASARAEVQRAAPRFTFDVQRKDDHVDVGLSFSHSEPEPTEVLVRRGRSSGAHIELHAILDGEAFPLTPSAAGVERREMMSRLGPIPVWELVEAGQPVNFPAIRFDLPREWRACALRAVAEVLTPGQQWTGESVADAESGQCTAVAAG